jgi:hypothetical protein
VISSVRDMVHLRWRTAGLITALIEGNGKQATALRRAMRVEGIEDGDMADEFRLLLRQFGHRTPVYLRDELARLWRQLNLFCTRCGRTSRHRDNAGVCHRCVLEEP